MTTSLEYLARFGERLDEVCFSATIDEQTNSLHPDGGCSEIGPSRNDYVFTLGEVLTVDYICSCTGYSTSKKALDIIELAEMLAGAADCLEDEAAAVKPAELASAHWGTTSTLRWLPETFPVQLERAGREVSERVTKRHQELSALMDSDQMRKDSLRALGLEPGGPDALVSVARGRSGFKGELDWSVHALLVSHGGELPPSAMPANHHWVTLVPLSVARLLEGLPLWVVDVVELEPSDDETVRDTALRLFDPHSQSYSSIQGALAAARAL